MCHLYSLPQNSRVALPHFTRPGRDWIKLVYIWLSHGTYCLGLPPGFLIKIFGIFKNIFWGHNQRLCAMRESNVNELDPIPSRLSEVRQSGPKILGTKPKTWNLKYPENLLFFFHKKLKSDTPAAKRVIFEVASTMTQSPSIWTNYPWLVIENLLLYDSLQAKIACSSMEMASTSRWRWITTFFKCITPSDHGKKLDRKL